MHYRKYTYRLLLLVLEIVRIHTKSKIDLFYEYSIANQPIYKPDKAFRL